MRGLPFVLFIFLDKADFFPQGQQQVARDASERYIAKSNPWIVMVSTPNAPDGLFEKIEREPEDTCLYRRLFLDYTYGLDRIYTREEIEKAKASPSFEREHNLKYLGKVGNVFHTLDIEAAICTQQEGEEMMDWSTSTMVGRSMGIDVAWGDTSKFAIVITQYRNRKVEVFYAESFEKPLMNNIINHIMRLKQRHHCTKVYVDSSNPEVIRELKNRIGEYHDYHGTDYSLTYRWDTNTNNWTKTLRELSPYGKIRFLDTQQNYSVFDRPNQSYVDFSMDLKKLNYPDQYDVLFYAYDYFKYNNETCPLSDITQRVYTPAPQFDISTSPSSIEVRPGEEREAKLQFKSNANIKSFVQFSVNTTDEFNNALIVNFSTDRFSVPPHGIVTSSLDIKATGNATPGSYMLPIFAHIDLPTESKPRRGIVTGEILYNTVNQQLTNTANLTMTVLPSLTILDSAYNILNTWGSPIRNLVEIVIVIGGAVGAGGLVKWVIGKIRKNQAGGKT